MKFPKNIIVAALNFSFILRIPENAKHKPSGLDGRLLETLAEVLRFRYQLTLPPDKEWGRIKDGNWTGLVRMVHTGEADISIGVVAITQDRFSVMDFTIPYLISDVPFVTEFPALVPRAYTYLYSFDVYTWLGIFSLLFVLPMTYFLTTKGNEGFSDAMFVVFAQLLGKSLKRKALKGKLLPVCWCFPASVISFSFSAVVLSVLFIPIRYPQIKSFEALSELVKRGESKVFLFKGSLHIEQLIKSKTDHLMDIGEAVEKNGWYVGLEQDLYALLSEPGSVFLNTRLHVNYIFGLPPSNIKFISSDGFYLMFMGIAVSKTFCCKEKLNSALMRILEAGLMEKFYKDELLLHMPALLKCRSQMVGTDHRALSLSDLSGAFFVLMLGYMASFISLIAEGCCNRYKKY